jgi:abortive infection bacteriophage resistance protein
MSTPTKPPYSKPALTFGDQVTRLQKRGMAGDPQVMEQRLSSTNYYRLSGYFYFFRQHQGAQRHLGEQFRSGLHFDHVWEVYEFDGKLRSLVMQAIEKIEIAIRTQVSYHHAHRFGAFAYALDPASLPNLGTRTRNGKTVSQRDEFMQDLRRCIDRSHELYIDHFYATYADPYPPIWMASEILTLSGVLYIYEGSPYDVQRQIASHFNVPYRTLGSWLLTLNTARNVCAHHSRFWNRALGQPQMPSEKALPYWHKPIEIYRPAAVGQPRTPTTFAILSICNHLLSEVCPASGWAAKVKHLLDSHQSISRPAMGVPHNWTSSPVWHDV